MESPNVLNLKKLQFLFQTALRNLFRKTGLYSLPPNASKPLQICRGRLRPLPGPYIEEIGRLPCVPLGYFV